MPVEFAENPATIVQNGCAIYVTRAMLNPSYPSVEGIADDPYRIHQMLCDTFPCSNINDRQAAVAKRPKIANMVFRIERTHNGPDLIIYSDAPPDWTKLRLEKYFPSQQSASAMMLHPGVVPVPFLRQAPQTAVLALDHQVGTRVSFALRAVPTVSKRSETPDVNPNSRGHRVVLTSDAGRVHWLSEKLAAAGALLLSATFEPIVWYNTKPSAADAPPVRLTAISYHGKLEVQDPARLAMAIRHGIGTQKAFGFGLLLLDVPPNHSGT